MSAYDQTKGELCDKCGWAMKFPGEPCLCELERENAALRDALVQCEDALRHALIMSPLDPFQRGKVITAALDKARAAIDAARKEAQP